mgnify:CR=1 FL=1
MTEADLIGSLLPLRPAEWPSKLGRLTAEERGELAAFLVREWVEGRLEPRFLPPRASREALTSLRRQLVTTVEMLVPSAAEALSVVWKLNALDENSAGRWCWIEPWYLLDQDEDLFLMDAHFILPLLEEIGQNCPKRTYAIEIILHGIRDKVHGALFEGPLQVRETIGKYQRFVEPARRTRADGVADYIARLEELARPQKVDREGARERIAAVWRCAPPAPEQIKLEEEASEWLAPLSTSGRAEWIVINRHTGAMQGRSEGDERRRRTKR